MKTVTMRELNRHTAQVLAEVEAGEAVLVTERGVPQVDAIYFDARGDR